MSRNIEKKPLTLSITPIGESKLQHWEGGGIEIRIAQILHDEGPTTINEFQKKLNMDEMKVRAICREMVRRGWAIAQ